MMCYKETNSEDVGRIRSVERAIKEAGETRGKWAVGKLARVKHWQLMVEKTPHTVLQACGFAVSWRRVSASEG